MMWNNCLQKTKESLLATKNLGLACHEEIQEPEHEPGYLYSNYWGFLSQGQGIAKAGGKSIAKFWQVL